MAADLLPITVVLAIKNEEGKVVERVIPKSEFRKKFAIFFFDNESGDKSLDWLQIGITELLGMDLYQDLFLDFTAGISLYPKLKQAGFSEGVKLPLTLKLKIAKNLNVRSTSL